MRPLAVLAVLAGACPSVAYGIAPVSPAVAEHMGADPETTLVDVDEATLEGPAVVGGGRRGIHVERSRVEVVHLSRR